jgi:hypothetical protein
VLLQMSQVQAIDAESMRIAAVVTRQPVKRSPPIVSACQVAVAVPNRRVEAAHDSDGGRVGLAADRCRFVSERRHSHPRRTRLNKAGRTLGTSIGIGRPVRCHRLRCSDYHHQPCLGAQRSRISEMASMINEKMISGIHRVDRSGCCSPPRPPQPRVRAVYSPLR